MALLAPPARCRLGASLHQSFRRPPALIRSGARGVRAPGARAADGPHHRQQPRGGAAGVVVLCGAAAAGAAVSGFRLRRRALQDAPVLLLAHCCAGRACSRLGRLAGAPGSSHTPLPPCRATSAGPGRARGGAGGAREQGGDPAAAQVGAGAAGRCGARAGRQPVSRHIKAPPLCKPSTTLPSARHPPAANPAPAPSRPPRSSGRRACPSRCRWARCASCGGGWRTGWGR